MCMGCEGVLGFSLQGEWLRDIQGLCLHPSQDAGQVHPALRGAPAEAAGQVRVHGQRAAPAAGGAAAGGGEHPGELRDRQPGGASPSQQQAERQRES